MIPGVWGTLSSSYLQASNLLLLLLLYRPGQGGLPPPQLGDVGCLFSDLVCTDDELCYNDQVIGRCISASSPSGQVARWVGAPGGPLLGAPGGPLLGAPSGPLLAPEHNLLEAEMTRVFGLGFSWPDTYTQCVFQTLLYDIQTRQSYSEDQCAQLITAPRLMPPGETEEQGEEEGEDLEPQDILAPIEAPRDIIEDRDGNIYIPEENLRYFEEPSEEEVAEYLDNFYPPQEEPQEDQEEPEEQEGFGDLSPEEQMRAWQELQQVFPDLETPDQLIPYKDLPDQEELFYLHPEDLILLPPPPSPNLYQPQPLPTNHLLDKRGAEFYPIPKPTNLQSPPNQPRDAEYIVPDLLETLYNTPPQNYRRFDDTADDYFQEPSEDDDNDLAEGLEDTDWTPDDDLTADGINLHKRQSQSPTLMDALYDTDDKKDVSDFDTDKDVSNYDFDYEDSGAPSNEDDILYYNPDNEPISVESVFDRHERLDVKKPGPFYINSPNNFFLDKLLPEDYPVLPPDTAAEKGQTELEAPLSPMSQTSRGKKDVLVTLPPPEPTDDTLTIHFNRLDLESQAERLVMFVAEHLGLQPSAFSIARQPESSRLVLTVHANPRNLNASSMASLLNKDTGLTEHASRDLGINIHGFEAGSQDGVTSMPILQDRSKILILILLFTAGLAAIISVAGLILIIRRRSQQKAKIQEIKDDKEEPVKEYKQLVRDWSRSSRAGSSQGSTGSNGAGESNTPNRGDPAKRPHKISHNSEGSRTSSTSSWQEEPSATSMDISTGHMVLSYMEDHLKNKQRLEQEWVGLCAYEAEPNSTAVAFKVENKKKNRYPDKLPYDHNRVLLNSMVNGTNSDYINASTVMDHDPRNPAYIVSQGPMAHTVADFWQMVWEQGSVVIVMLSRLAENGYQLAQRYWPEEGSEQYHIFEVHLVSEHVWCEDYLVRSLYLKNSQTGETRTVTQFHFLSWPDATIPNSTRAILEFRRKVNKSYRGRSCPMIIHCSDGVGRSGTYVLIDMVLNRMTKGSKEIDIAATLEHIRDQRAGMVQTRSQFEFCLMAVAEETHAILKALPQ